MIILKPEVPESGCNNPLLWTISFTAVSNMGKNYKGHSSDRSRDLILEKEAERSFSFGKRLATVGPYSKDFVSFPVLLNNVLNSVINQGKHQLVLHQIGKDGRHP